jgi:CHAT domain-containing protein
MIKAQNGFLARAPSEHRILLISESNAAEMPQLFSVNTEVEAIEKIAKEACIPVETASAPTIQALSQMLPISSIVHLACHGTQDVDNALDSGFMFAKETFTIEELMALDLPNATLAFLSACETAKGDEDQPDQVVHLAAAMLFCGFRSVIGTMW